VRTQCPVLLEYILATIHDLVQLAFETDSDGCVVSCRKRLADYFESEATSILGYHVCLCQQGGVLQEECKAS